MIFSSLYKYRALYLGLLPAVLPGSTLIKCVSGVITISRGMQTINIFANIIGYTSVVLITSLTYPIGYVLLGCYFLYNII